MPLSYGIYSTCNALTVCYRKLVIFFAACRSFAHGSLPCLFSISSRSFVLKLKIHRLPTFGSPAGVQWLRAVMLFVSRTKANSQNKNHASPCVYNIGRLCTAMLRYFKPSTIARTRSRLEPFVRTAIKIAASPKR